MNLIKCFETLNPTITRMNWPTNIGMNAHEFEVIIKYNNFKAIGRGLSFKDADHALEIATTEAIERVASHYNGIPNTNGVAAHTNPLFAKTKAIEELVERHVFLNGFYSAKLKGIESNLNFKDQFDYFKTNYSEYRPTNCLIGKIDYNSKIIYVTMNIVRLKNNYINGYVIGLGASEEEISSQKSAEIENLRFLSYLKSSSEKIIFRKHLNFETVTNFEDHGQMALSEEYYNITNHIYSNQYFLNTKVQNIKTRELALPEHFKNLEITAIQAKCEDLLPLFTGMPSSAFNNTYYSINNAPPSLNIPHPIS